MSKENERYIRRIAGWKDESSDSNSRGDSNPTPPSASGDSSKPTLTYRGAHPSGEGTVERNISRRGEYFVDNATGNKFTSQQFERIQHKLNERRSDNVVEEGGNSEGSNAADSGSDGS